MLDIDSIIWRNFLSYGDYDTQIIGLSGRGPTLITGEIFESDGVVSSSSSNGAGKSTITVAIVWCLFGRTFTKDKPGDNVVNYFVGENCFVEIRTTDGWKIRRTRKMNGHDDLIVEKDGRDETRSTNTAAQEFIERKFNLNFHIFCSSAFFGQMSKPILDMPDQNRKETLERLLGLDLLNTWAQNAKDQYDQIENTQEVQRRVLLNLKNDVETFRELIENNKKGSAEYMIARAQQIESLNAELNLVKVSIDNWDEVIKPQLEVDEKTLQKLEKIKELKESLRADSVKIGLASAKMQAEIAALESTIARNLVLLDELGDIDFDDIIAKHDAANIEAEKYQQLVTKQSSLELSKRMLDQDLKKILAAIKEWKDKEGTTCPNCKQNVVAGHIVDCTADLYKAAKTKKVELDDISGKLDQLLIEKANIIVNRPEMTVLEVNRARQKLAVLNTTINDDQILCADKKSKFQELEKEAIALTAKLTKITTTIASYKNMKTLADIESSRREQSDRIVKFSKLEAELERKRIEVNPYDNVIAGMKVSLKKAVVGLKTTNELLKDLNTRAIHYQYLSRAYTDRNKVKKLMLASMIPYLNQRIQYYLECFRCNINISFKDNLAVDSNIWQYEYCSGGEKRRIDLSIMFALHDLYLGIHGKQCNIMVLDEVDGRLDGAGIETFIEIINNDFTKSDSGRSKPGTVFVISHRPEMADAFPSKLLVRKDVNGFSHLVS